MMWKAFVLLFILKIRFPESKPISNTIRSRFGQNTLKLFRDVENSWRKLRKAELDLEFLNSCKTYRIVPNFLKFKLYRRDLYNDEIYREFQTRLLEKEIFEKEKNVKHFMDKVTTAKINLKNSVSFLNYSCLIFYINQNIRKFSEKTKLVHKNKIEKLGGTLGFMKCRPDEVIFNYSNRTHK